MRSKWRSGSIVSAAVQYWRRHSLPLTTPAESGTTRAATGEVNTTSSWKCASTASTS
jgi:ABC-type uncharacterized transport system permease subunit